MRPFTHLQYEVVEKLEELVHSRFTKEELTDKINEIFGNPFENISIDWNCYEDGGLDDNDAMFTTLDNNDMHEDLMGDFDIYWLPCNNNKVYVTEVGYDF